MRANPESCVGHYQVSEVQEEADHVSRSSSSDVTSGLTVEMSQRPVQRSSYWSVHSESICSDWSEVGVRGRLQTVSIFQRHIKSESTQRRSSVTRQLAKLQVARARAALEPFDISTPRGQAELLRAEQNSEHLRKILKPEANPHMTAYPIM